MNSPTPRLRCQKGTTMVEAIIAMGVLAVAVPLTYGALAEAGKAGLSAQAETRSTWIIPACIEEIQNSRAGSPQYFTATKIGQPFPPAGDVWALAFAPDGRPVGKMPKSFYDRGTKELDGKPVRFIAVLSATSQSAATGTTPMLNARITIEYPASVPAKSRGKIDFHTRIP